MKRVKLPEICTIPITDGTHQTPTYTTKEDGIPFISSKDVTTKKIDWTNIKYITKDLHEQLYKRIAPQKNDILLAKNGTTGVAALVEDNRVFDIYVTLAVIRPDLEKVFPKYLLHVINSDYCKKQFSSHLVGIGVPNLHLKDINQTSIPLPSLPEQQKIAAHLDSIQSAIDNKKQQLQQLDELVKSKFVEMFGENPVENGKWKVEKLGKLSESILGKMLDKAKQSDKEKLPYLANFNVKWFGFDLSELNKMPFSEKERQKFQLKAGDILMCEGGEIGRCAVWNNELQNCYFQKALHRIRVNFEVLNPTYLVRWFKHKCETNSFDDLVGKGATFKHLTGEKLKVIEIPVPPIKLQNTFAEYVQKIDSAKSIIKTQIVDLQELLYSKMDEYFGE